MCGEKGLYFFRLRICVSLRLSLIATHPGMNHRQQIARAGLTLSYRSPVTCRFCAHENAADSKFCSECGGALHLLPCPHCGALNDVKKKSCYLCHHRLSGCATDDIAHRLPTAEDFASPSHERSQETDEAAVFAEIKALYHGVSKQGPDDVNHLWPSNDVSRPDDVDSVLSAAQDFAPSPIRPSQGSNDAAIFSEIKRLYDGVLQDGPDDFSRPSLNTYAKRPGDIAPLFRAAQDLAPSPRQPSQESDEAATRRKIKELYYSNLRRRTRRYDRPSSRAGRDRPNDLVPRLLVAKRDSIFRRRLSQSIIGMAILAVIVVLGYYEYHQRFLGDAHRSLVVKTEQRGEGNPDGARSDRPDMATLKTIAAQNTGRAYGQQKTFVWHPEKVNDFWKGLMSKTADALANLVAKTPEPTAAPATEPAE